jgi:anthranilate synthase component 1
VKLEPDFRTFRELFKPGRVVPVWAEVSADTETPVSAFLKISHGESHAFLFESVKGGDRWGRWSFLGAGPRSVHAWAGRGQDPLVWLAEGLLRGRGVPVEGAPRFSGGFVGYLGYDAITLFEPRIPLQDADEHGFPRSLFMEFDTVLAFDSLRQSVQIVAEAHADGTSADVAYRHAAARIERCARTLRAPIPATRAARGQPPPTWTPRVSRRAFEAAVARAQRYIFAGDAYQIVVSQRFDAESSVRPFDVYRSLRRINPSPYLFFLKAGPRALVGSSPELLVRLEGEDITLRPIAGTRRRGRTPEEDGELEAELRADPKENAEHVMLVDLGRNDVGRVAKTGSVRVAEYKTIERYSHVMHMVSEVRGQLATGKNVFDVLCAAFPHGTVTGAPKIRAMEILAELEPARRGPYAGSVGYLDRLGNLEMCIALRTLACAPRRLSVQAGAGIVFDSKPAAEYQETLDKARALMVAVAEASQGRP